MNSRELDGNPVSHTEENTQLHGETIGIADRPAQKRSRSIWLKAACLPVLVVVLFVLGRRFGLGSSLGEMQGWMESHLVLGAGVFILVFTVIGISALPGLWLTLLSGAIFGSLWGIILTSVGTACGAALAFLLGRTLARDAVSRWLESKPLFSRLERWTSNQGALVVVLSRLFPIFPFSLLNYSFGLTSVKFRTYILWTWLAMLPGTIVYVVGADALATGLRDGEIPWTLVFVFVIALGFLVSLIPWARKRIREQRQNDDD
ncbi:MAG: TVP38/TMEM64 family protein [bacterium]|nr:TVP38/TMEM64 family protein [bacterium]